MARIRSSGTKPERYLYQTFRSALGYRWRIDTNVAELVGKPDLVVPSLSLAVFVDGCFFHSCPKHGRIPDSRQEYWKPKLEGNIRRDARVRRQLRRIGFSVWRFWSHDFNTIAARERTSAEIIRRLDVLRPGLPPSAH